MEPIIGLFPLSPPSQGPARHSRDRSLENQGRIEQPAVSHGNNGLSTRKDHRMLAFVALLASMGVLIVMDQDYSR